jgi:hypothetical protein
MFKDLEKVIAAEMPDFVAVKRTAREAPPRVDQVADSVGAAGAEADAAAPGHEGLGYRAMDGTGVTAGEGAVLNFFGTGDPRERLARKHAGAGSKRATPAGIISVEPAAPEADSSSRRSPMRRMVVRDGKIVGEQG